MRHLYWLLFLFCCIPTLATAQRDSVNKPWENSASVYNSFVEGWKGKPFTLDSFHTMDGSVYIKKDLEGKNIFFRSSFHHCSPCRAELPVFVRMSLQHPDVLFVYITYDGKELIEKSFDALGRNNVLIVRLEKEEIIRRKYALAYPTNFFVDRQGIVKRVGIGGKVSNIEETEKEWEQYLSEL